MSHIFQPPYFLPSYTASMIASLRCIPLVLIFATAAFAQAPATVRTVTPTQPTANSAYSIPGRTEPYESARIFTRATGIIKERSLDIGDRVRAGDVLAVVAVPELDRAVEAAHASVEQATIRAANSKRFSDRSASLLGSRVVSQEESDQRAAEAAADEAALRAARAELGRLEEQRNFATVRAPFDAVIAARNFDRGDRVRGDSATAEGWLFHLVRLDKLRFAVFASPDLALRLVTGTAARVTFAEFPGRTFTGAVARSSRVFDPTSGTMRVELEIENSDLALPSGLTGTAVFDVAPAANTFLVPTNTVVLRVGKNQLATVREGKVTMIDIAVGRNFGAQVEVASAALTPTTAVIVNPNALLRPGDVVQIAAPPAPAKK